ncbi:hypothetical protein TNCV_4186601 [Trichonephila clavipes]|nr:hypothetical protein TNCV_4186601 [Trichonephila clavipes]
MQPHERLATKLIARAKKKPVIYPPLLGFQGLVYGTREKADLFVDTLEDSFQENRTPYDDDHIDKVDRTNLPSENSSNNIQNRPYSPEAPRDPYSARSSTISTPMTSPPLHWSTSSSLCGRCRHPKPTRHPAESKSITPEILEETQKMLRSPIWDIRSSELDAKRPYREVPYCIDTYWNSGKLRGREFL